MFDGLLILSPHNLLIAAINYGCIHLLYTVGKMSWDSHFANERKDAIRHHFWNGHTTDIEVCKTDKCATL